MIGLGISEGDISSRGLAAMGNADEILVERYTLPVTDSYIELLEKESGKKIKTVIRKDLEDDVKKTLEKAIDSTVVLLVPGDPLVATTHQTVLDTAREMGIGIEVYHASSVFTAAIGESGLDIYKFGPTTTIPFWSSKYKPTSFIDTVKRNLENNQHTLVLLDVDAAANKTMSATDALALLRKAEEKKGQVIHESKRILILCEIGAEGQTILYTETGSTKLQRLEKRLEGKRTCLIIPAELSFAEEKLVSAFTL